MTDSVDGVEVGAITIRSTLTHDGDEVSSLSVTGDLSIVTQLGMLRMAEDTILRIAEDE